MEEPKNPCKCERCMFYGRCPCALCLKHALADCPYRNKDDPKEVKSDLGVDE